MHVFTKIKVLVPFLLLPCPLSAVPLFDTPDCPSTIPLNAPFNITWNFKNDPDLPYRGVVQWSAYSKNSLNKDGIPITSVASVSRVNEGEGGVELTFDGYRFGEKGIVNYTGQPLW